MGNNPIPFVLLNEVVNEYDLEIHEIYYINYKILN